MTSLWKPGDLIVWRGIYRERIWHAQTVIVVKDTSEEMVVALLPGTIGVAEVSYRKGKKNSRRRWDFKDTNWQLAEYTWQTNRLLILLEPQKFYSTMYFWNDSSNEFLCYYINFQLPFHRSHCGIDTLDLDLDLIIRPDFSYAWKDLDEYQKAIDCEIIFPEWVQGIENAKPEIFNTLENRHYPFDSSWLDWLPAPTWTPPTLPENWDKI